MDFLSFLFTYTKFIQSHPLTLDLQEQRLDGPQDISSIHSDLTSNMAAIDHNSVY
jgi:hypothetical protein